MFKIISRKKYDEFVAESKELLSLRNMEEKEKRKRAYVVELNDGDIVEYICDSFTIYHKGTGDKVAFERDGNRIAYHNNFVSICEKFDNNEQEV